jgi:hypothetical protein
VSASRFIEAEGLGTRPRFCASGSVSLVPDTTLGETRSSSEQSKFDAMFLWTRETIHKQTEGRPLRSAEDSSRTEGHQRLRCGRKGGEAHVPDKTARMATREESANPPRAGSFSRRPRIWSVGPSLHNSRIRLWVADINYVCTKEGILYLVFVLYAYSRRVVGWSICISIYGQRVGR